MDAKKFLKRVIFSCFVLLPTLSQAKMHPATYDMRYFAGLSGQYAKFALSDYILQNNQGATIENYQPGVGAMVGWYLNNLVAGEIGYTKYQRTGVGIYKFGANIMYAELQMHPAMNHYVNLIGALGVGRLHKRSGLRLGAGVNFKMNDQFHARIMANFQNVSHGTPFANITELSVGILYHFNYL